MPLYDFVCTEGHIVELQCGYDEDIIKCPTCGHMAVRNSIYQNQSIITETGSKFGRRAITPPDQVNLKPAFDLYREAAQEIEYKYEKLSQAEGRPISPSMARQGMAQAKRLQKLGVTVDDFRKRRTS